MPVLPDDLPRSRTGRVPRWVIDEASGIRVEPDGWRTYTPQTSPPAGRSRLRNPGVVGIVLAAVIAAAWWWPDAASDEADLAARLFPPSAGAGAGAPAQPPAAPATGQAAADPSPSTPTAAPSAEVVALADAAHLSDRGREVFYATAPQVLDEAQFLGRCDMAGSGEPGNGGAVGCYFGGLEAIVLYKPADPRLGGQVVEAAAHELLHAAWNRLTDVERADVTPLLEAEVAAVPGDDPIHVSIAGSVGTHPENRATELFAYVGTRVWRDGGLAPQLQVTYAGFIADRAALVAVHDAQNGLLDGMRAEVDGGFRACATQEVANAAARQTLQRDTQAVAHYQQTYETKSAEVAAMPDDQRNTLRLSWAWWDGTELPMAPAEQTLALAGDLLARDHADLAAHEAALHNAEEMAAAERARIEAILADLQALESQVVPGP